MPPPAAWDAWLGGRLEALESRSLLRSLRPVIPTDNPVEARGRCSACDERTHTVRFALA